MIVVKSMLISLQVLGGLATMFAPGMTTTNKKKKSPWFYQRQEVMKITVEVIEQFIREEIAEPELDRTVYRSWYKYAKETGKFNLTHGHAPGFCETC